MPQLFEHARNISSFFIAWDLANERDLFASSCICHATLNYKSIILLLGYVLLKLDNFSRIKFKVRKVQVLIINNLSIPKYNLKNFTIRVWDDDFAINNCLYYNFNNECQH